MADGFDGAKLALISQGRVLSLLRDDRAGLPFAGMWDLPGGGREGQESPEACVLRELHEEFGLHLPSETLCYRRSREGVRAGQARIWFFGAIWPDFDPKIVRFGDEGQGWEMMPIATFVNHSQAVPHLQSQLSAFVETLR